jgi:hypothetical protein
VKIFAAFPSKYLKAADLHDKHVSALMSHVLLEELQNKDGTELCPILYFNGVPKGMVLNKTNAKTIAAAYGDETDAWAGMPIVLFPAMVAFGAETVEAIRMKAPSAAERNRHIRESPHREALAEHSQEEWVQREGERMQNALGARPAPTTEADMERARQVFLTKKPTPHPVVTPINEVVWEETEERPATAADFDDGLDIPPALDRRPKREPSLKERLLGVILGLSSPRECLTWGLEMDRTAAQLPKAEREEVSAALLQRQTALLNDHVPPAQHQARLFPINGGLHAR